MNLKWLTITLLIISVHSSAQQVIEYDTITKALKSEIPYDVPFILKVPFDQEIEYVDYIKVKGKRAWYDELLNRASRLPDPTSKRYQKIDSDIKQLENQLKNSSQNEEKLERKLDRKDSKISLIIDVAKSELKKEGNKTFLYITFDWDNTFDPNSEYAILLNSHEPGGIEIYDLLNQNGKWKDKLESIRKNQIKKYGLNWSIPSEGCIQAIYEKSGLQKLYDSVSSNVTFTYINSKKIVKPLDLKNAIKCLVVDSLRKDCGLNCKSINNLLKLDDLDTAKLRQLSRGQVSISNVLTTFKLEEDLNKRVSKLDQSLKVFVPILQRLKSLSIAEVCDITSLQEFEDFVQTLQTSKNHLTKSRDNRTKIKKIVYGEHFQVPETVGSSTFVIDFQTRAKTRIIPDFGLIFYGLDFKNDFVGFSPYLGFRVNLRPLNKNIPWSKYPNKNIFHYTSVMVGWTLTSVAEEGKREDLFGSKSFITGLGIKLYSHSIMLNVGALWFQKIDPNPVINTQSMVATPYLGISIDLDLKDLVGGLGILK